VSNLGIETEPPSHLPLSSGCGMESWLNLGALKTQHWYSLDRRLRSLGVERILQQKYEDIIPEPEKIQQWISLLHITTHAANRDQD